MKKSPRLLIGASNKIYLFEPDTERLVVVLEREKRKKWLFFDDSSKGFFGISLSGKDEVVVAAREKLGTPKAGKPSTDVILHRVSLSAEEKTSCKVLDVHDVHQISCYEGKVYLTDTGKNRVVVSELDSGRVLNCLNVGQVREDVSHINAVSIQDDFLYVGLNNRGDKDAEIIKVPMDGLPEGECDLLDPTLGAEIIALSGCCHTHDVHLDRDGIMFCASHDGNIHYVGEENPFYSSSDWVRGLASNNERVWVGVSQKAERGKRHSEELFGEIVEIDKSTGRELRRINIPGAGQVNDLLLLSH